MTKPIVVRSFFDTDVLVYADAGDEPRKQARAAALLAQARLDGSGVLSVQVLQEFAHVALRKLDMPIALLRERLAFYAGFDRVPTTPDLISSAIDLHASHGVSFYDALVVRAAITSGCQRLWSEDLQDGRRFESTTIADPFASARRTS